MNPDFPLWLPAATLATEVAIVVVFVHYLKIRDKAQVAAAKEWADRAETISNRCHENQSEATKVLRELTVAVARLNGH